MFIFNTFVIILLTFNRIISTFEALISLGLTLYIYCLQKKQSDKIEQIEKEQREKEEKRYWDSVETQACEFISKHYENRGLIPLCAIASMYNRTFGYYNKMYREFCWLGIDVQNRILELENIDFKVQENIRLYEDVYNKINTAARECYFIHPSLFHDYGKYLTRLLEKYGNSRIEKNLLNWEVADIIDKEITEGCDEYESLADTYFQHNEEYVACQFVNIAAQRLIFSCQDSNKYYDDYGSPGSYAGEQISTGEDLFLQTLFFTYTRFILDGKEYEE